MPLYELPSGRRLCMTCIRKLARLARRWLLVAAVLGITPYLAWASCAARITDEDVGGNLWLAASCVLVPFALMAAGTARRAARDGGFERLQMLASGTIALALTSPVVTFFLGVLWEPGFSYTRGRAHRRRGRARTPDHASRADWLHDVGHVGDAPPEAARGWRLNAATETASVAAFSHLAAELLALGAPPRLIAEAHEDALDEIRHARLCYALATAIDGRPMGPAAFAPARLAREGRLDVVELVRDCVVESCLYEAASARVAATLAARDDLPAGIAEVLAVIAEDEARHAAHGFEIGAWCVRVGPPATLDEARRALRDAGTPSTTGLVDGLEPWGLAGPTIWLEGVRTAYGEVETRLSELADAERAAA